jgi:hypothetical protein
VGGVTEDGAQTLLVANLDAIPRLVDVRTPGDSASVTLAPGGWTRRG